MSQELSSISLFTNHGLPYTMTLQEYELLKKLGMLWEFYPDAPATWPCESSDKNEEKEHVSSKITLTNPGIRDLILACHQHVPEYDGYDLSDLMPLSYLAVTVLHKYPFSIQHNPDDVDNKPFSISIKCKGNGCKSREVIGEAEAETLEKAAMVALLRANGVEVMYTK